MERKKSPEASITRILVAVDASSHSITCLEMAGALAESLHAELQGLYVEDINLINLAGLPFARELIYSSQTERVLTHPEMENRMRHQADNARQSMAKLAEVRRVSWSFEVVRGQVTATLLSAARESDLVIVGVSSAMPSVRIRLGSTARRLAVEAPCPVLLVGRGLDLTLPVVSLFDGSHGARHALEIAAKLAQIDAKHLIVITVLPPDRSSSEVGQELDAFLSGYGLEVSYRYLNKRDTQSVQEAISEAGGRLLVVDAGNALLDGEELEQWVDKIRCPILLAR